MARQLLGPQSMAIFEVISCGRASAATTVHVHSVPDHPVSSHEFD